ncbi:MAG: N-acetylmuramoyl-L-alanine amidase [Candidatus Riflebacteria bacterium]|nr:N-acetylmuramoyl-L-alanine amidase [Candidatus Riflebacteria bacterium]
MKRNKIALVVIFLLVAAGSFAQNLKPLKGISIMLDPGHGGTDPGAVGPTGLKESAVNLRVARYLRDLLRADGADVMMTREGDTSLSLGERVILADKHRPDLFVSIHHNASLKPVLKNRGEIYYNAIDHGLSRIVGRNMTDELIKLGFGDESIIVPAGFFVLRNNPSSSILTEGSYISIPAVEKGLKTGKALTNQAEALRRAIKESFKDGILRINMVIPEEPLKIDTSYFNLIFSTNKNISRVHARLTPEKDMGFAFDKLPGVENVYRFYNTAPMVSGNYELQMTFTSTDGSYSARTRVKLQVSLPFAKSIIKPTAPFIAEGFKGRFPVEITLFDEQGKLNARSVQASLIYGETSSTQAVTAANGKTTLYLDLTGNEKQNVETSLIIDKKVVAKTNIAVKAPSRRYILGRLISSDGNGIQGARIKYAINSTTITGPDGHFYCDYPMIYGNVKLSIQPPPGYKTQDYWVRTAGELVTLPLVKLTPISAGLLGKRVAVMAPMSFDNLIRKLVKPLMAAGAEIVRLNLPENQRNPEYQAVLEANLQQNLDLIISFKREVAGSISVRHYHRGGKGKRLADALSFSLAAEQPPVVVKTAAGSDYEIGHTGATAVVISFPEQMPPDYPEKLIAHLARVLQTGY